jgi:hypothetical protein
MEDYAHLIHLYSSRVMKFSFFLNLLNVGHDIFSLSSPNIIVGSWLGVVKTVLGSLCSILLGLSTTITALYGSMTLDKVKNKSVWEELLQRYLLTNIKEETLRVNKIMETIDLPRTSPLYTEVHLFKTAIRDHMLSRKGLSGMLNILATIFIYYNCLASTILYGNIITLDWNSRRLLYLMLNVINPCICFMISYLVVLCDNPKSIVIYSYRVNELLRRHTEDFSAAKIEIEEYTKHIERPLYRQLWSE